MMTFVNDLLSRLSQCEEDKVTKDSQIRSLRDEYTNQVRKLFSYSRFSINFCPTLLEAQEPGAKEVE